MKYRKKPIVVEAFRLGYMEAPGWYQGIAAWNESQKRFENFEFIETLEGTMIATKGDWVIKGIKGELYPCKHEIFVETYEPAD